DVRPAGPVQVSGRLSAAGAGRFYWHGRIAGSVEAPCRRCLAEARADVSDECYVIYVGEGAGTPDEDDPDVFRLDRGARELDLRPAIREAWLLAAPGFVLCRPDCKGLCPRCGADLNLGPCACPPQTDSRWDALRKAN